MRYSESHLEWCFSRPATTQLIKLPQYFHHTSRLGAKQTTCFQKSRESSTVQTMILFWMQQSKSWSPWKKPLSRRKAKGSTLWILYYLGLALVTYQRCYLAFAWHKRPIHWMLVTMLNCGQMKLWEFSRTDWAPLKKIFQTLWSSWLKKSFSSSLRKISSSIQTNFSYFQAIWAQDKRDFTKRFITWSIFKKCWATLMTVNKSQYQLNFSLLKS